MTFTEVKQVEMLEHVRFRERTMLKLAAGDGLQCYVPIPSRHVNRWHREDKSKNDLHVLVAYIHSNKRICICICDSNNAEAVS